MDSLRKTLSAKLKTVPWSGLNTATGNASAIPEAILGLLSPDPEIRQHSYWQIDNHVVLQSDLFESAYAVVPFLIEILRSPVVDGRELVYRLLFEIANGSAPPSVTCRDPEGKSVPLRDACRTAVLDGVETYLRDLGVTDDLVRQEVLDLIESLPEARATTLPALEQQLSRDQDSARRQSVRNVIQGLGTANAATPFTDLDP